MFLLLAMALTYDGWTVDRSRPDLVAAYAQAEPGRSFPDYAGHNIGALVVEPSGQVVSFALNRNVALNSSLEHAEARAVRRAIGIANAEAGPEGPTRWSFGALLRRDCVYTTLEPCAQCAGIMDLANLRQTIFAQEDPTQRHMVNVIYNLQHRAGAGAPLPIAGAFFPFWHRLAEAARQFQLSVEGKSGPSGPTAFLETIEAYRIYRDAAQLFETFEPRDAANTQSLAAARALRRRWSLWLPEGVGPV